MNNIVFVSGAQETKLHMYVYLSFFKLFPHLGCYTKLSRAPWAIP